MSTHKNGEIKKVSTLYVQQQTSFMAQIKSPKIGGDDACPQDSVTNFMSANYNRLFSWLAANRHYNKRSAREGGGFLS